MESIPLLFRFLGVQWLAVGFVALVSLGVSVVIARTLGPELFGIYSIAISGGAVVAILLDGGFGRLLQREHAQPTPALAEFVPVLPRAAYGHSVMCILFISLLAAIALPQHALTTVAAIWFYGASVLNQFSLAILRGKGRMVRDASWQVGNRAFTAVCVGLVIVGGASQPWQILFAQFAGAAVFGFVVTRFLRVRPLWKIPPAVYGAIMPFIWLDLATVLYFRVDMLLLEWFDVAKFEVGKYGVAYRLIEAIILFASPVGLILFRRFRLGSASPRIMLRDMLPAVMTAQVIGMALMVAILFFSKSLIALAYGAGYSGADHLLAILGCALVFILPNGVLNQAALALGLERWFAISATVAAVVNIVGNMILMPQYGLVAAAWMTVLTEAVLGCCVAAGLWRHRSRDDVNRSLPC